MNLHALLAQLSTDRSDVAFVLRQELTEHLFGRSLASTGLLGSRWGCRGRTRVAVAFERLLDRRGEMLQVERLEIDTVDGFQGREKEAVLISLVVSRMRRK